VRLWSHVRARLVGGTALAAILLPLLAGPAHATNDTYWARQWGPAQIGAPQAWSVSTGAGVIIGIVDTGVDLSHPDLAGKIAASTDCTGSNGDSALCRGTGQDDNGHGTHVSGIAAAATNNGTGIAGVAPDARVMVAKALDSNGSGSDADIVAGIHWVVDHGARVVNLSVGDPSFAAAVYTSVSGSELGQGIEYAWSKGAVPVLAAGNNGAFSSNYGNLDALVVGATDRFGQRAGYSSSIGSAKWGIMAPGGSHDGDGNDDIVSTWLTSAGSYATAAGTSMATPHVAGAVALLLAKGYSRDAAVQQVLDTAQPLSGCGCHGRLDAARALGAGAAPAPDPVQSTPNSTQSPTSGLPTSGSPPSDFTYPGPTPSQPPVAPAPQPVPAVAVPPAGAEPPTPAPSPVPVRTPSVYPTTTRQPVAPNGLSAAPAPPAPVRRSTPSTPPTRVVSPTTTSPDAVPEVPAPADTTTTTTPSGVALGKAIYTPGPGDGSGSRWLLAGSALAALLGAGVLFVRTGMMARLFGRYRGGF